MTPEVAEMIARLREHMPLLAGKYHVRGLEIFGSYVHGRQKRGSDVDILVEFSETVDLFTFVELQDALGRILGLRVDLVMKEALKPRIREKILREAQAV